MLQLLKTLDRKAAAMINDIDSGLGQPTVQVLTLRVFTDASAPAHHTEASAPAAPHSPARQPVRAPEGNPRLENCCAETAPA